MKILLVEDNEADRVAVERAFKDACFEGTFLAAQDGNEAWTMISKESPDLILLDLNMPGKDGRELLKEIKGGQYSSIPIVILTSSSSQSDICECYRGYASSYFSKPMSYRELRGLAKRIFDFWEEAHLCASE